MARATSKLVQAVLLRNYDAKERPDLTPFIAAANSVVNQVLLMSRKKPRVVTMGGLTVADLTNIEVWLSAHFYCINDPLYSSRSTQGASGSFQRASAGEGFASTDYGKQALAIDWSGCLMNINSQQYASGFHMGLSDDRRGTGC